MHIERANIHCQGIDDVNMGLTSAEGQKQVCFKLTVNNIFISNMKTY